MIYAKVAIFLARYVALLSGFRDIKYYPQKHFKAAKLRL